MVLRLLGRLACELVAPSRCAACDDLVDPRRTLLFCGACATTLEGAPARSPAVFAYGGAIAEAIVRLKYGSRPDLGARLGEAMATCAIVERLRERVDVVVPVPLHRRRLALRGYNQAALLARPVARRLSVPLAPRALERVRDTPRQASLGRDARQRNVTSAFSCREPMRIEGARVVLVDDVRTTGTTLAECTAALAFAGAREVVPFVLASREDELREHP